MTLQKQLLFWLGTLALLVLALVLLSDVLLPFTIGMALAYFLDPLVDRITRLGVSRLVATVLIIVVFLGAFVGVGLLIFPLLAEQIGNFIQSLPGLVTSLQALVPQRLTNWVRSTLGVGGTGSGPLGDLASEGAGWAAALLTSVWSGGRSLVSSVGLLVLSPVVAFYMLLDWDRMIATVDGWVPRQHRATVEELARQIDRAIAGFIRGQAILCMLLGAFYAIALSLVGLNFSLLIGLLSGLLSFIPFVGSLTGFLLSVGVALVQFWPHWPMVAVVVGVFLLGQFIEGNILQPRLVGRSVGLHPVWTLFALVVFSSLFGFLGALLAIPLAAAIGVLTRFALRRYLASPIYDGKIAAPPDAAELGVTVYLSSPGGPYIEEEGRTPRG